MLIDTHCHLDFPQFDDDREAVIVRAKQAGVMRILIPGTDLQTSERAAALAEARAELAAAVGVHPHEAHSLGAGEIKALRKLAGHPRVAAVGEIGLDYFRNLSSRADQARAFRAQLALAAEVGKPVIVHNREAGPEVLAILREWASSLQGTPLEGRAGVLHSFSADVAEAEEAVALGFFIGISGPVTYKTGATMRRVAASVPLQRLLVETDSPYLAPQAARGQRNEPARVRDVAAKISAVRGLPFETVARQTTENAITLFGREYFG